MQHRCRVLILAGTRRGASAKAQLVSGDSTILARQTFDYDKAFLDMAVTEALEFWLGTRDNVGVDLNDTWKCDVCEYKANCEWREEQASIFSQKMASKR